jgi:hypothetical protein
VRANREGWPVITLRDPESIHPFLELLVDEQC